MFNWLNFLNFFFFFLFFTFLTTSFNFFCLVLTSELMWALLLLISAVLGSILDDFFLASFSFLILGFASVELSIGLILMVYLKTTNLSLNLEAHKSSSYATLFLQRRASFKKKI